MPYTFLLSVFILTLLIVALLYGEESSRTNRRDVIRPSSLSLSTEPNRPPAPETWQETYVPIEATRLTCRDGTAWVTHQEHVPLLHPDSHSSPRPLRRHRLVLN